MRDLYEEIQEYYTLTEVLTRPISSRVDYIEHDKNDDGEGYGLIGTKYAKYQSNSERMWGYHNKEGHIVGNIHDVSWENNYDKKELNNHQKHHTLTDAIHLHNHFIKHETKPGDVIKNTPLKDENESGNKRSRIYTKVAKFGNLDKNGDQYGIIKQHPDNHPEKHLRSQKYLHPASIEDIESHKELLAKNKSRRT